MHDICGQKEGLDIRMTTQFQDGVYISKLLINGIRVGRRKTNNINNVNLTRTAWTFMLSAVDFCESE